jgi:hypothetical protein
MGNHHAGSKKSEQYAKPYPRLMQDSELILTSSTRSPGDRKNGNIPEHIETEPLPRDHPHILNMRLQNIELQTAVQSWITNELSLALYQLYHEFQHLMPSAQPLQRHQQMQTLLDSLEAAVPSRALCGMMRQRAEHVLAQGGLEEFGFDVRPPPFYDATVKASQLRREDVQTVPEQLCSIELHNQEHSPPIVRLPRLASSGNEMHQLGENGPGTATTKSPESQCQSVNGVCSGIPKEEERCVDTCSTQQGVVMGNV